MRQLVDGAVEAFYDEAQLRDGELKLYERYNQFEWLEPAGTDCQKHHVRIRERWKSLHGWQLSTLRQLDRTRAFEYA